MSPSEAVPDRTRNPSAQIDFPQDKQDNVEPSALASGKTTAWKPALDRRQTSNEQDMKRKYQERLLGTEGGKEAGFSSRDGGAGGSVTPS